MRRVIQIFALVGLVALPARTQIKGCTSDVRTGICNKTCSTKHVAGCALEQLDPLLKIQSMNCLTAAAKMGLPHDEFEREAATCSEAIDKEIEEWKKTHPQK